MINISPDLRNNNKQIRDDLDRFQTENERIQASLDQSKKDNASLCEKNKRVQDSLDRVISEKDDFKHQVSLKDQVAERERKTYTDEINTLKTDISSYMNRINDLKAELRDNLKELNNTKHQVKHKDISIANAASELSDKLKEIENLRDEVLSLQDKLSSARDHYLKEYSEQIKKNLEFECKIWHLEDDLASKEKAIIEASSLLKEYEARLGAPGKLVDPKTSKYGGITGSPERSEEVNSTSTLPITVLGAGKALVSDQFTIPPMFKLAIFVLIVMLIIWYMIEIISETSRPGKSSSSEEVAKQPDHDTVIPVASHPGDFIRGDIEANYYNTRADYQRKK